MCKCEHYGNCDPETRDQEYCIFHKPDKTEDEAREFYRKFLERFKPRKEKIIVDGREIERFVFENDMNCRGYVFPEIPRDFNFSFRYSNFESVVYFDESTFFNISFEGAVFNSGFKCVNTEKNEYKPINVTFDRSKFNYVVFRRAVFCDVSFEESEFRCVDFDKSVFSGYIVFRKVKFISVFSRFTTFSETSFDYVDFSESKFECVEFSKINFKYINFRKSTFKFVIFKEINFIINFDELHEIGLINLGFEDVFFDQAKLQNTSFEKVSFIEFTFLNTHFEDVIFRDVVFLELYFNKSDLINVTFDRSKFNYVVFRRAVFCDVSFEESEFRCVDFDKSVFENTIRFTNVRFKNLKEEAEVYRIQKICYEREGREDDADKMFVRERRALRKLRKLEARNVLELIRDLRRNEDLNLNWKTLREKLKKKDLKPKWIKESEEEITSYEYLKLLARSAWDVFAAYAGSAVEYVLADFTCKYGTDWKRPVILWVALVIFVFPFIYCLTHSISGIHGAGVDNIWNCLYFSVVTATTLGYGDLHPVGWGKAIASAEAIFGMFMWAVFLAVFSRKYMR